MQEDVIAVRALWAVDAALKQVSDKLRALDKAVTDAEGRVAAIDVEIAAANAALVKARADEALLQRKLNEYVANRDRARKALDTGTAADYAAVERQFQQCTGIVGDLENQLMASMESIEGMEAAAVERTKRRTLWAARLREAVADRETGAPPLLAEQAALQPQRAERWKVLTQDDRSRYEDLTRRGLEPFATIGPQSNCSACYMVVQPQMILELTRGTRTHYCRGCRRWLLVE